MWLFTKDGFYSVVKNKYCGPDEVAVRARTNDDILNFCLATKTPTKRTIRTPEADYLFRVHVSREVFTNYVHECADQIDYPNFKNKAIAPGDHARSDAYHKCWEALHAWQERTKK